MSTYDAPTLISPREVKGYWQRRLTPPTIRWEEPRVIVRLGSNVPLPFVPTADLLKRMDDMGYEQLIILSDAVRRTAWKDPETGYFYVNPDEYASYFQAFSREQWERVFSLSPGEKFNWRNFR